MGDMREERRRVEFFDFEITPYKFVWVYSLHLPFVKSMNHAQRRFVVLEIEDSFGSSRSRDSLHSATRYVAHTDKCWRYLNSAQRRREWQIDHEVSSDGFHEPSPTKVELGHDVCSVTPCSLNDASRLFTLGIERRLDLQIANSLLCKS